MASTDTSATDAITDDNRAIADAASELLDLLAAAVPDSTIHYAVEDARKALRTLHGYAATGSIRTVDNPRQPDSHTRQETTP